MIKGELKQISSIIIWFYNLWFNDTSTVPEVPALTSVSRLSGTSAVISWTPLTQDEARRFLITALELAYEPVIDSALNCSTYNFTDSATILIWENLFEQSTANISGLEPHREYCIAIKVSTTGGESGFSSAIKLPCKLIMRPHPSFSDLNILCIHTVPRGAPFQIKLKLPDDLKCSNMVVSKLDVVPTTIHVAIL